MKKAPEHRPGEPPRPASISEVAAEAGVSVATVSRVINGKRQKFSQETEVRVRAAIAALNYRPAGAGRALRQGRSRLVAVLAANLANPTMAAIAASTEVALRSAGYAMVLCDTHDDPSIQDEYLLEMQAQFALAFVLLAPVDSPQLTAFSGAGAPLIFVNRRSPADPVTPVIGIDNAGAAADVAGELYRSGARRVGLVHGPLHSSATQERVVGFREEWGRLDPNGEVFVGTDTASDHLMIGYEVAGRLLAAHDLQALVCLSDLIAFGAHKRAEELGRRIDFFGFDDAPLNEWVAPWLSSVHIPYADFGPAILRRLTDADSAPGDIVLPHELRIRR